VSQRRRRLWPSDQALSNALEIAERVRRSGQERSLLPILSTPMLYTAARVQGSWPEEGLTPISECLRPGAYATPARDRLMGQGAILLAAAVHAHAVLAPTALVPDEPLLWPVPDPAKTGTLRWGLLYPIQSRQPGAPRATLMIAPWDVRLTASTAVAHRSIERWVVALPEDPGAWQTPARWNQDHQRCQSAGWDDPRQAMQARRLLSTVLPEGPEGMGRYGRRVEVPPGMAELAHAVGAIWAPGRRCWLLPAGFDTDAHVRWLSSRLQEPPIQRYEQYLWAQVTMPPRLTTPPPSRSQPEQPDVDE